MSNSEKAYELSKIEKDLMTFFDENKKKHGNLNARIKTLIPFAITLIGLIILLIIGVWYKFINSN